MDQLRFSDSENVINLRQNEAVTLAQKCGQIIRLVDILIKSLRGKFSVSF